MAINCNNVGPHIGMFFVNVFYAVMPVISKLSLNSGMNPVAMLIYRAIAAVVVLSPFVYLFERHMLQALTRPILYCILLSSFLGITLNQLFYVFALQLTTPTIVSAVSNLFPGITLALAVLLGMEILNLTTKAGKAKVIGTLVCVCGAMVISFYHGKLVLYQADIYWSKLADAKKKSHSTAKKIGGFFCMFGSCFASAGWFLSMDNLNKDFPAPLATTLLINMAALPQLLIFGVLETLISGKSFRTWAIGADVRLGAALYTGALISAFGGSMSSWCIGKKSASFAAMYNSLTLILVAFLGWLLLHEKIYVGTLLGGVLILGGLYIFIWGRNKGAGDVQNQVPPREPRLTSEEPPEQVIPVEPTQTPEQVIPVEPTQTPQQVIPVEPAETLDPEEPLQTSEIQEISEIDV